MPQSESPTAIQSTENLFLDCLYMELKTIPIKQGIFNRNL